MNAAKQTTPLLSDREEKKYKYKFLIACLNAAVLFVFALVAINPRQSVPNFPQPKQPDELERYRRSGMYWSPPWRVHCGEIYHLREYVAQLHNVSLSKDFNMIKACEAMPIEILNQTLETPDECSLSGVHVYGHWTIYDPNDCTVEDEMQKYRKSGIYWESPRPNDCGEIYHLREYVSQLHNVSLSKEFNVIKACKAMPIEILNQTLETPDECSLSGVHVYGHWTIYDPNDCTVGDEMQRYRSLGMFWDVPQPAQHCHSYDKREYEARLQAIPAGYDWNKACNYMPVTIHDQVIEKPDSCELRDDAMYGKWFASRQLDCKPYWGPLKDVGCQASGKKRYEAPLWNLIKGDDWHAMCASTPATWNGRFYEHPTTCDYRNRGGMTGIWESENC